MSRPRTLKVLPKEGRAILFSRQTEAIRPKDRFKHMRSEVADDRDREAVAHEAKRLVDVGRQLVIVSEAHQQRSLAG